MPFHDRKPLFEAIERLRRSKVLLYVTGDRPGLETQISSEIIDIFADHLDLIGPTHKISLILYSNGGNTAAAWGLINLLRIFADDLEVLLPAKAHSAATLISLGANRIVMTQQATLGPIDPSLNSPLNPPIPGGPPDARMPVSVEAVKGYLDAVKNDLGVKDDAALAQVFISLSSQVHPLVLGQIFRSREQIRQIASKLLVHQVSNTEKVKEIISFLCSDSGSHDHTINRREARELGLEIEKASSELYYILRKVYTDFSDDLRLREPYNPIAELGSQSEARYCHLRCLIESNTGGSHRFVSRGKMMLTDQPVQQMTPRGPVTCIQKHIQDVPEWVGWEKIK